jgi:hypothetical protein
VWVNSTANITATNSAGLTVSSGATSSRVMFQTRTDSAWCLSSQGPQTKASPGSALPYPPLDRGLSRGV